jgi:polyphenol oxidase
MALLGKKLSESSIRHAFFTRKGGVSKQLYASMNGGLGSQDNPENVQENRSRMANFLKVLPENFLSLYQIHSPHVVTVNQAWTLENRPKADAMVTKSRGFALAIATADCGSLLFADPKARVIGAAHAGWKGALGGIVENTIQAMESLGANRADICAVLGATISAPAYEVGLEFKSSFLEHASDNDKFFTLSITKQDKFHFNLPLYIAYQMQKAGIKNFEDLQRCTYTEEADFFSFRRATHRGEPDYGRQISAIMLAA